MTHSSPSSGREGPLAGYRIVDISSVMAAPFATHLLADHGADVIKVEAPAGDIMRVSGPSPEVGMSPIFQHMNRNKRSIVLDLKSAAGRDVLIRLVETADAFVYNIRPAAMERLGLGYATLRELNPRLVYCGVVGYGQGGRYEAKPAYDDLIQGAAGIPELFALASRGEPKFVPFAITDRAAGLYAASALLMAFLQREKTGVGDAIEVALFETAAHFLLVEHMFGRSFDPPLGTAVNKRMIEADRRPFPTRDGYLCALPYTTRHWRDLSAVLGIPDVTADARFADFSSRRENISELYALLAEHLVTRTTDEWLQLLDAADIPAVRCATIDQLLDDPHLEDRGFFRRVESDSGVFVHMASPLTWSSRDFEDPSPAPRLSEDGIEVLREVGYSAAEIDELIAAGVTIDGAIRAPTA